MLSPDSPAGMHFHLNVPDTIKGDNKIVQDQTEGRDLVKDRVLTIQICFDIENEEVAFCLSW